MRGSITIFATMLLMLVSQFLFTVLEAGRNLTLTNIACMNSEAVAESVFAQYCRPLWDEYHFLHMMPEVTQWAMWISKMSSRI